MPKFTRTVPELSDEDIIRFNGYVKPLSVQTCWKWCGPTSKGYGIFYLRELSGYIRPFGAHRVSILLHTGMEPRNSCACHKCDNPICVNPFHLYWGTQIDNIADRCARKRTANGEAIFQSKLTRRHALWVRETAALGLLSKVDIAKILSVHPSTVHEIITNQIWRSYTIQNNKGTT